MNGAINIFSKSLKGLEKDQDRFYDKIAWNASADWIKSQRSEIIVTVALQSQIVF